MNAHDIMVQDVITVGPDATVNDVARIMYDKRISGVPVVDPQGRLLGIVTEEDVLHKVARPHLPTHIELLGGIIYFQNPHDIEDEVNKLMALTAGQIMTQHVPTVTLNTPVEDVAALLLDKHVTRAPVVEDGILRGIITRHDLLRAVVAPEGGAATP